MDGQEVFKFAVRKVPELTEELLDANTSAASIPILFDELVQTGRLRKGQKIVLAGFGAGLTWAGSILEW